jgi:hypothetical protein
MDLVCIFLTFEWVSVVWNVIDLKDLSTDNAAQCRATWRKRPFLHQGCKDGS